MLSNELSDCDTGKLLGRLLSEFAFGDVEGWAEARDKGCVMDLDIWDLISV